MKVFLKIDVQSIQRSWEIKKKKVDNQEIWKLTYFTLFQSFSGGQTKDAGNKECFTSITSPYYASDYGRWSETQDRGTLLAGQSKFPQM